MEDKHKQAYTDLKRALQGLPTLGLPNYDKAFTLFIYEWNNQALDVLTQDQGGRMRPIAYYSMQVDALARA